MAFVSGWILQLLVFLTLAFVRDNTDCYYCLEPFRVKQR